MPCRITLITHDSLVRIFLITTLMTGALPTFLAWIVFTKITVSFVGSCNRYYDKLTSGIWLSCAGRGQIPESLVHIFQCGHL